MNIDFQVSVIVGCRNRCHHLKRSLPTWLKYKNIRECIVVDFNSDIPVENELDIQDDRIKIYRIIGVDKWILSLALNFGLRLARHSLILKLDADTILSENFFDSLEEPTNFFYSGNWKMARNENEQHLNGIIFASREAFLRVGGYNEYIRTYGWDDTDLYERLVEQGYENKYFPLGIAKHIPHGDDIRSSKDERQDLHLELVFNMHLSRDKKWQGGTSFSLISTSDTHTNFKLVKDNVYVPIDLNKFTIREHEMEKYKLLAIKTVLNDACGITWEMTMNKNKDFLEELYKNRKKPKFYIQGCNGLGNRLRAIASAAVIAEKINYLLIIIWVPDIHLNSKMSDLYDISNLLVTSSMPKNKEYISVVNTSFSEPSQIIIDNKQDIFISSACVINNSLTSWKDECYWLKKLKLISSIQKEIDKITLRIDFSEMCGVHIRMGQPNQEFESCKGWKQEQIQSLLKYRNASHYSYFIYQMKKMLAHNSKQKFFLCADNKNIYEKFNQEFGKLIKTGQIFYLEKNKWDRSSDQLVTALIDVYLLSKTSTFLGSPWSSFTELVSRLASKQTKLIAGVDFAKHKFGVMCYNDSLNIGDTIQSIAAEQYLPIMDCYIDRDNQHSESFYNSLGEKINIENQVLVIENGWFDSRFTKVPFSKKIIPLFVSFHLNDSHDLFRDPRYNIHKNLENLTITKITRAVTLQKFSPIGTRDTHTSIVLTEANIKNITTWCLTLTLDQEKLFPGLVRGNEIYIVDAHIDEYHLLEKLVPKHVRDQSIYITHGLEKKTSILEKQELAMSLLKKYCSAKLVITNRLHCALPCLAFGTPFIFLYGKMDTDVRYDDTYKFLLGDGKSIPQHWNWENPKIPKIKLDLVKIISEDLKKMLYEKFNEYD